MKLRSDSTIVITPSGGKPFSLNLLDKYMQRQTDQDFFWIVSDDCIPRSKKPERCDHFFHPEWVWEGENTQCKNLCKLLNFCLPSQKIIECEDDDWYCPDHVKKIVAALEHHDLVGESYSKYYNVGCRHLEQKRNVGHSGLCSSGFKGEVLNILKGICCAKNTPRFPDSELWKVRGISKTTDSLRETIYMGMKGMPGRGRVGHGHERKRTNDPEMSILKSIIGCDAQYYESLFELI